MSTPAEEAFALGTSTAAGRDQRRGFAQFLDPEPALQDLLRVGADAVLQSDSFEPTDLPPRQGHAIVAPSHSYHNDELPGTKPLLVYFKLLHGGVDAGSAQASARQTGDENLRFAARLIESDLDNPGMIQRVVIESGAPLLRADGWHRA